MIILAWTNEESTERLLEFSFFGKNRQTKKKKFQAKTKNRSKFVYRVSIEDSIDSMYIRAIERDLAIS